MVEPSPREGSRYYYSLWSRRKPLWERLVWITSLRSCLLPLFDQYLPLPLPAGGGGARVATLAFCARLWSSDQDGPGPPLCSGSDLDLLGMKVLKAAERALASVGESGRPREEREGLSAWRSSLALPAFRCLRRDGETGASSRKPFSFFSRSARFTHRCLSVTTMAAIDLPIAEAACLVARRARSNQIKSKSNHFYCHITTAQVPWWVKFLWACSRQCRKTTDNLHMDRQSKKTTNNLHMDRQCKKKKKNIYIWTDSAKNCTGAFTVLQTVQKNNNSNLHMDRQCKKNNNSNLHMDRQCKKNNSNLHMDSTYLQTVQKTMCKIHIHALSTLSVL